VIRATPGREEARSGCQGVEMFYSYSFRSTRRTKCEADDVHRKRRIAAVEQSTKESQVTAGKTRLWRGKKTQQNQTLFCKQQRSHYDHNFSLSPALFFLSLSVSLFPSTTRRKYFCNTLRTKQCVLGQFCDIAKVAIIWKFWCTYSLQIWLFRVGV
jgi:hypothetical protein